jgi:hypothetical protein
VSPCEGAKHIRTPLHHSRHLPLHRSILKLLAFQAYPLIGTTTGLVEPHATACLEASRAICHLAIRVAESPDQDLTSPFLIWACWVAGRVLFGEWAPWAGKFATSRRVMLNPPPTVHACLSLKTQQEPEFEPLIQCLHAMKADWSIAGAPRHARRLLCT